MKPSNPKQEKVVKETPTEKYLREILELLKLKASQPIFPPYCNFNGCPPHNFVPYQYTGTWVSSMPPPEMMICTKCLMTAYLPLPKSQQI